MVDAHEHDDHFEGRTAIAFSEAIGGALVQPEVKGAERRAGRYAGTVEDLPRVTHGPSITVMPGARVAPVDMAGLALQASLVQSWSLGDLGARTRTRAGATAAVAAAEATRSKLDARLEAAHAWIHLHGLEAQLEVLREELATAVARREAVEASVSAGFGLRSEVHEAEAHESTVDARVVDLEGQVHDAGLALATAAGADPSLPLATQGEYPGISLPPSTELRGLLERVEELPAVALVGLRRREARARSLEVRAATRPRLSTGISGQREGRDDVVLYGVLGISIAGGQDARLRRVEAEIDGDRADTDHETALRMARAAVAFALHELEHSELLLERIETRELPALQRFLAQRQAQRSVGEATLVEELWARHRWLEAQQRVAQVRAAHVWSRVRLWLLLAEIDGTKG